jgi:hypothetical protein
MPPPGIGSTARVTAGPTSAQSIKQIAFYQALVNRRCRVQSLSVPVAECGPSWREQASNFTETMPEVANPLNLNMFSQTELRIGEDHE